MPGRFSEYQELFFKKHEVTRIFAFGVEVCDPAIWFTNVYVHYVYV